MKPETQGNANQSTGEHRPKYSPTVHSEVDRIISYQHHGHLVYVIEKYKGVHQDACLCIHCKKFTPKDRENSCPLANELYSFCVKHGGTAIRQECADFERKS